MPGDVSCIILSAAEAMMRQFSSRSCTRERLKLYKAYSWDLESRDICCAFDVWRDKRVYGVSYEYFIGDVFVVCPGTVDYNRVLYLQAVCVQAVLKHSDGGCATSKF